MQQVGWRRAGASLLALLIPGLLGVPGLGPASLPRVEGGEEAPAPRLDRIDYAKPDARRSLGSAVGVGQRSRGLAAQLGKTSDKKDATPFQTLTRIARWVDRNLTLDPLKAMDWRTVDQILADGTYGGIADHALVIGALARAAGIPAVWVKALPTSWLVAVKSGTGDPDAARGHVFLEVHLGKDPGGRLEKGWALYDPATAKLYTPYDPATRSLPGGRLAFDKGDDPFELVLPNRVGPWRAQVAAFVKEFDPATVPWTRSRDLLARWRVYVAGKGGSATCARATARAFGFNVEDSFQSDFDRVLPRVRGKTLLVLCERLQPVLPRRYWAEYLPPGHEKVLSGAQALPKGWIAHELADGTRVILVTAEGFEAVELAVSEALESKR